MYIFIRYGILIKYVYILEKFEQKRHGANHQVTKWRRWADMLPVSIPEQRHNLGHPNLPSLIYILKILIFKFISMLNIVDCVAITYVYICISMSYRFADLIFISRLRPLPKCVVLWRSITVYDPLDPTARSEVLFFAVLCERQIFINGDMRSMSSWWKCSSMLQYTSKK